MGISKEEYVFIKGDAVIHPTLGAGIIVGLPNFHMQKENQQYYKIRMIAKAKTIIMIPVDNAEKIGLRHATSRTELDAVWNILADSARELPGDNRKRVQVLQDKVKNPGISILAEVIRDLEWQNLQRGHLNNTERRIYEHAMEMLTGEIAVSLDVQMQSARTQVKNVLDVSFANAIK